MVIILNRSNQHLKKKNIRPKVIIANTVKGSGIDFMEDDNNWHYRSPNKIQMNDILKKLS